MINESYIFRLKFTENRIYLLIWYDIKELLFIFFETANSMFLSYLLCELLDVEQNCQRKFCDSFAEEVTQYIKYHKPSLIL